MWHDLLSSPGARIGYNNLFMRNWILRRIPTGTYFFHASIWLAINAAIVGAPWLASRGQDGPASLLYSLFARVCHQDPARCFAVAGQPWAVCHRCSGIYLGLLLLSLFPFELTVLRENPRLRRIWIAAASAPLLIDVALQWSAMHNNTPVSRFGTGLIFGLMLSSLLAPALTEFFRDLRQLLDRAAFGGLR
jgi:uncharacterized membrane protein